jgi:putative endonuclease
MLFKYWRVNTVAKLHCVYILECCDGSYYTGVTSDLERRLMQHSKGLGSKYVRSRRPFKLVYCEEYGSSQEARRRELEVKRMSRREKHELVLNFGLNRRKT